MKDQSYKNTRASRIYRLGNRLEPGPLCAAAQDCQPRRNSRLNKLCALSTHLQTRPSIEVTGLNKYPFTPYADFFDSEEILMTMQVGMVGADGIANFKKAQIIKNSQFVL
jgi:hypothetical protein